jgi:hypothetical protein
MVDDDDLRARIAAEAHRRARPARGLAAQFDELAAMYRHVATRRVGR